MTNPTPQYADLCERLLRLESSGLGAWSGEATTNWYRNPDGPEAATALQSIHAENERLREIAVNSRDQFRHLQMFPENCRSESTDSLLAKIDAALSPDNAGGGND